MTEGITIREYRKSDELEWLDVHASVMVDSAAWWIVLHRKPTYKNETVDLVACHKDRIVGFITVEINPEILSEKNVGFVWEFGVHRSYRRRGIGRALVAEAHRLLDERYKIKKTVWYSQDENAQKYYEHLGMKEIDRHWQFSIRPDQELKEIFKRVGFDCWDIRGSCQVEDFERIKKRYELIEDDETLRPRICIGYEYVPRD